MIESNKKILVVIGITTYKRPQLLRKAIECVAIQSTRCNIEVVVADNDAIIHEGKDVVADIIKKGYPHEIISYIVEQRGITYARNFLMDYAFNIRQADYIAFVDDDQQPTETWLDQMVDASEKYNSELVGPAVHPIFRNPPPDWVKYADVYNRDIATEGIVACLTGNGGILVKRTAAEKLPLPWYDNKFALTGGEDAFVFSKLEKLGVTSARASNSIIYEYYPDTKVGLFWAMKRDFRIGNNTIEIGNIIDGASPTFKREFPRTIITIAKWSFLLIFSLGNKGKTAKSLCKISRGLGKISVYFGYHYREYKNVINR